MLNNALRQRSSYGKRCNNFTGKELDAETGLYYYGARYLDPKTSRWLSGDPALGEYFPSAPVNDEAKKHNQNLPGMGGVFNYVNLHAYHYAGNNPVKYVDPDGKKSNSIMENKIVTAVRSESKNEKAINKIGEGIVKIIIGQIVNELGMQGGAAIIAFSEGTATKEGVAVAAAGMIVGGAITAVGIKDVLDGIVMLSSSTGGGRTDHREKTEGANRRDREQIDNVARDAKIDRREFGKFIDERKKMEGRGPSDNYTYKELLEIVKEFKELQ
jgi:RHS repeat-associated protein